MLTYDDTVTTLRSIVDDFGPEYRPTGDRCIYFDDGGTPVCIIGHLIDRTFGDKDLRSRIINEIPKGAYRTLNCIPVWSEYFWPVIAPYFEPDNRIQNVLGCVQRLQDQGLNWGEALTKSLGDGNAHV